MTGLSGGNDGMSDFEAIFRERSNEPGPMKLSEQKNLAAGMRTFRCAWAAVSTCLGEGRSYRLNTFTSAFPLGLRNESPFK